jgi:plasmid maintenance system antidote protein VapI
MLKNNIEIDIKTRCIESGKTQMQIAQNIGTTPSNVNKLIRSKEQIMNKTFIAMMEDLGYDVRLVYEKRELARSEYRNQEMKKENACWIFAYR